MTKLHRRQLKRVRQFIRRAEKRGYVFTEELKQGLRQDKLSTQKLKTLTPKKLYSQSENVRFGETISGTRARDIERSLSAKKAAETRERRRYYSTSGRKAAPEGETTSYEDKVLQEVESLISQYYTSKTQLYSYNSSVLDQALKNQIRIYGRRRVAVSMEQAPEQVKALVSEVIFASTESKLRRALTAFYMIITGTVPTIEESKQFTDYEDMTDSDYMQNADKEF